MTGNIFEACKRVICAEGIPKGNIYCAAIGGTIELLNKLLMKSDKINSRGMDSDFCDAQII